jgi:hypothetical protein
MQLLTIVLVIIVVGVLLWLINRYIQIEAMAKQILNIVVIVFLVIWLSIFGLLVCLLKVHD